MAMDTTALLQKRTRYELHFPSLTKDAVLMAFPCDVRGHVNIDQLAEDAKIAYLYARALIGRDYLLPRVQALEV
jgi:hypothetical protein